MKFLKTLLWLAILLALPLSVGAQTIIYSGGNVTEIINPESSGTHILQTGGASVAFDLQGGTLNGTAGDLWDLSDVNAYTIESAPGTAPTATGTDAIGIGDGAVAGNAAGDDGVLAIGARSTATGDGAIAIGENADATGSSSIAIGGGVTDANSADATGNDTIAIGTNSLASNNRALAVGLNAEATSTDSIAIGVQADATGANCIAIGGNLTDTDSADCTGAKSIALGSATLVDQTGNVAIGDGAEAITGAAAIAIGQNTDATGDNSIAIGGNTADASSADATGTRAIAIGNNSFADATSTVAIGVSADAGGVDSIAIGSGSNANGTSAIALGDAANASGANCIAIGGNAVVAEGPKCTAADSVALGQNVTADDIGESAYASGWFATTSDAHTSVYVLRNQTTDGTQTELFADGSAGDISIPSDCTTIARISIVARQANEDGTSAMYFIVVGLDNNAGTTAVLAAATITTIFEDTNASAWDVNATADDANDGINVLVTGAASDNINWVARTEVVESCG